MHHNGLDKMTISPVRYLWLWFFFYYFTVKEAWIPKSCCMFSFEVWKCISSISIQIFPKKLFLGGWACVSFVRGSKLIQRRDLKLSRLSVRCKNPLVFSVFRQIPPRHSQHFLDNLSPAWYLNIKNHLSFHSHIFTVVSAQCQVEPTPFLEYIIL